jgi:phosphate transport system permease protein
MKRSGERIIEALLRLSAWFTVLVTVGVVGVLAWHAVDFFKDVSPLEFFFGTSWTPLFVDKQFGILPLLSGTLLTASIALVVALPLGLLISIYLSEFAPKEFRKLARPALDLLAAIPTVVYGFIALVFVTPLLQFFFPSIETFNALSPGLVMALMVLPIITSISEDSMRSVPANLREAALALGASRWQVALRVVLPASFSGVTASLLLAFSRALGETMIVAIAAGQQARLTLDPTIAIQTASSYIIQLSLGDVSAQSVEYKSVFAVGLSLFLLTFLLNNLSFWLRARFKKRQNQAV